MKRIAAVASVLLILGVAGGGAAADTFTVRLVSQTSSTLTLGWDPQPGYGYLFSADGVLRSRTNDASVSTVKFSKQYSTFEVAVVVKGALGVYPAAPPPPPPPPPSGAITQTIVNGSTVSNLNDWRAVYDANGDGVEDDPGLISFFVDGTEVLTEMNAPFGDTFANGTIVVPDGTHTFLVKAISDSGATLASNSLTATVASSAPPPPPPPTGFPDATNTGVPAGTTLTNYTGPQDITTPNTVIDSKTINTCLEIRTSGVIIRKSKITCVPANGLWGIRSDPGVNTGTWTLVEDTEVTCAGNDLDGVDFANYTLRRVNIHHCGNGMSIASNVTLEDSYLHDWNCCTDNHPDGIQFDGDLWGIRTSNVTIRHNTLSGQNNDGSPGNAAIISDSSQQQNILIENNLFYGGGYTLYCSAGTPTNYVVRNNKFSTRFSAKVGTFGPVVGCRGEDGGGNVILETGAPVDMTVGG